MIANESINHGYPLNGLRVLDLADHTGSFCSRIMADLGAIVIKIERPGGDPARWHHLKDSPRGCKPEPNPSFLYHNSNKRSITLDLEHSQARDIFLKLASSQDIIVHSSASVCLETLGLGFERLKKAQPGLILVTLSGFGGYGPRRSYKSHDIVAAAYGGHMAVTGNPDGTPLRLYGNQNYYAACLFGACAALLSLHKKNRTGEGAHINISLQEAASATLEHVMVRYFAENVISKREGARHWDDLFDLLPCKDGFIQITVFESWETLLELMVQDGLAEDLTEDKWKDAVYRKLHKAHLLEVLGRWTRRYTRKDLFEMGQLMQFPWGSVQRPEEILACPHLRERRFFKDAGVEPINASFPGLPFKLSCFEPNTRRKSPGIGEHNDLVYRDELGLDAAQIAQLIADGII